VIQQPVNTSGTQRKTTIVLAVLVAVLVIAAGLFLFLFLNERGATNEARDQVSATERQITGERDRLADTKSTVDQLEQEGQTLQSTNDKYQKCAAASKKAIQAVQANDDAALDAAIDEMLVECSREGDGVR
jgi:hypothetical protein